MNRSKRPDRENGKDHFHFNHPFLVTDANANQSKYKVEKCNYFANWQSKRPDRENGKDHFHFNHPFLVTDANANQSKYKVEKCNYFANWQECISCWSESSSKYICMFLT
jgi:predicted membrane-bound dolichyl-phosphate-mannose-protein mannosyltransferase